MSPTADDCPVPASGCSPRAGYSAQLSPLKGLLASGFRISQVPTDSGELCFSSARVYLTRMGLSLKCRRRVPRSRRGPGAAFLSGSGVMLMLWVKGPHGSFSVFSFFLNQGIFLLSLPSCLPAEPHTAYRFTPSPLGVKGIIWSWLSSLPGGDVKA